MSRRAGDAADAVAGTGGQAALGLAPEGSLGLALPPGLALPGTEGAARVAGEAVVLRAGLLEKQGLRAGEPATVAEVKYS